MGTLTKTQYIKACRAESTKEVRLTMDQLTNYYPVNTFNYKLAKAFLNETGMCGVIYNNEKTLFILI